MANDNNKDIELKIKVDASDVDKSMKDIEKASDKMSKNVSSDAKRMSKDTDKINKVFKDLQKTLKNSSKEMQNAFKNINTNGFNKTLNDMKNTATKTAFNIKQQLQDAFNVKGSVKVSTTTDKSNGVSSGSSMASSLAGSTMTGGAIGSKIAKELAQGMKQGIEQAQEIFAKGLQGVKSEAETLGMVFDGIDDSFIEQMNNIKAEVGPVINQINGAFAEMAEKQGLAVESFDMVDFANNLKVAESIIRSLQETFKGFDQGLQLTEKGMLEFKTELRRIAQEADDLTFGLSDSAKELEKLARPRGINTPLKPEDLERAKQLLQQMNSEVNNLGANINKINFIDNFDTTQLINSLERFEQAQTKTNAQPLINELQRMQQEANKVGISIKGVDEVLQQYSQIDANATKLTADFRNALVGVCQQFKAYNAQVQANAQAQALMKQRQAEINRHSTTLGQTLVKTKHHLQDFGTALKQAFSSGMQKAGQYIDNLKNKSKQLADAHKQAANKIKSANAGITASFKGLLATMAPFLTIIGVFNVLKTSITDSMGAIETGSKFASVFGSETEEMSKWIDDLNQKLGIGKTQMQDYTSAMYSMASNLGLTKDQAKTMSQDLSMLAQDMASFYNISSDDAFAKLKSYMAGSTEVLYEFGVVATEANLQQFALAQGINKSWSEMSQAEKTTLRYQFAMQGLSSASGDLARTLTSPSNQLRILKTNLQELKVALGNCFLPIIQVILPLANKLIQVLTVVTQKVADTIRDLFALFGVNISTGGGGGVVSDTFGDVADSSGVIADNFGEANKDAKEMAKSLASFDKLNVLNTNKSSGSSSSTGSTGGVPTIGGSVGNNALVIQQV